MDERKEPYLSVLGFCFLYLLIIFGPDRFIIPAMLMLLAMLTFLRIASDQRR